jgi:spore germination protein GerM
MQRLQRRKDPTMRSFRISLLAAIALIIAACGSGLGESDDPETTTQPTLPPTTTTTVVDTDTTTDTEAPDPDTTAAPDPTVTTTTEAPGTDVEAEDQVGDTEVLVYLLSADSGSHDYGCGYVTPVTRLVQSPAVLAGALDALLAGPTDAELADGFGSWFADDVGWELSSVTITNGIAFIDLTEDSQPIPNASTSCGSMALLAQLDFTATQFPTVDRTVYSFGGDVAAFYHWLQRDVPQL